MVFMALISLDAFAADGVGSRGGGEATSQAFVGQGWITYYQLSKSYPKNTPVIDLAKLKSAIENTTVNFVDGSLELGGIKKDAINDPERKTITVSRPSYAILTALQQKKLTLHEYLRFVGGDDSNYQISNPLIIALEGDPLVELEDAANRALLRLSGLDESSAKALCYDLAGVVPSLQQVLRYADDANTASGGKFRSYGAGRLGLWEGKPTEYCKTGRFLTAAGKIKKAKAQLMKCYLVLIERDLKITQDNLLSFLGRESKGENVIWDEYSKKLAGSCK
jgi:hypothetical protein